MKTNLKTWLLSLLIVNLFVSLEVYPRDLRAYFDICRFLSNEKNSSIVELYLSVDGNSLYYNQVTDKTYNSSVLVQIEIKNAEGIKFFDKFNLVSPVYADTVKINFNFKTQRRILLTNGNYTLKFNLSDNNNKKNTYTIEKEITAGYDSSSVLISDIQLLESYSKSDQQNSNTKNGYELISYISDFYPSGKNNLPFYCEIYNTRKNMGDDQDFLVLYSITNTYNGRTVGKFSNFSKKKTKDIIPILSEFDINDLPSGNYNLSIEVKDKSNKSVANKNIFFQRSNQRVDKIIGEKQEGAYVDLNNSFVNQYDEKTLNEYLEDLYPISSESDKKDINTLRKSGTLLDKQKYFLSFWHKKDPLSPDIAWNDYVLKVNYVNAKFRSAPLKGIETDRGRVFLKYGAPNRIDNNQTDQNRPTGVTSEPYEIWHYYKAGEETNRIFVFIQKNSSGDFVLSHSTVKGEYSNPEWRKELGSNIFDQMKEPNRNNTNDRGNREP